MKLTVLLRRQQLNEPDYGYLRAFIVHDGKRGKNLLSGKHYSSIEVAKREVKRELEYMIPAPEIVFEGPEEESTNGRNGRTRKTAPVATDR